MKCSLLLSPFALGLLLAACCTNTPPIAFDPDSLTPVKLEGNTLVDESTGNCPTNEFEIPGEGLRVMGGIGGLAVSPFPSTALGDAQAIRTGLEAVARPSAAVPTAILVVDDFNGAGLSTPGVFFPDQRGGDKLGDLPTRLDPGATAQQRALEQEPLLNALEAAGQVSHGALVFNHTLALVSNLEEGPVLERVNLTFGAFGFSDDFEPFVMTIARFPDRPDLPTVAAVDTEGFSTEVIAARVAAAVQDLAFSGTERFAVNFSFGLVPCSVLRDFEAVRAEQPTLTFEGYQEEVLRANGYDVARFRAELARVVTSAVGFDPLRQLAQSNFVDNIDVGQPASGPVAITYLAAAGNYRLGYSLYPGLWPEIVSTSAADVSSPDALDTRYSNTGEVLLPGGFVALSFFNEAAGDWETYSQVSVAGTSFAAPALSVFTAFDYSSMNTRCLAPGNRNTLLAFYDPNGPQLTLNLPLKEAVQTYCRP